MKKPVDIDLFARYVMPANLRERGSAIYFTARRANMKENKYETKLYRFFTGSEPEELTAVGGGYWFTDSGIIYVKAPDDKKKETHFPKTELRIMDYDGKRKRDFATLDFPASKLFFVSDKEFYFVAGFDPVAFDALKGCGGSVKRADELLKDQEDDYKVLDELPFWSNGEGFTNKQRARLFYWKEGKTTPLTDAQTSVGEAVMSEDGSKILFSAASWDKVMPLTDQLYLLDTATIKITDITFLKKAQHYDFCFVDGERIAVLANEGKKFGLSENPSLFLRDLAAEKTKTLVESDKHNFGAGVNTDVTAGRSIGGRLWYRDGRIYSLTTLDDSVRVLGIDVQTGEQTTAGSRGLITEAVSTADGFLAVAFRHQYGAEIYHIHADGGEVCLTQLNVSVNEEYRIAEPMELTFKNENGVEIRGWCLPPMGLKEDEKYPTVLEVHGGPKTAYGTVVFHEMQLLSAKGWAVIFCNPTGSDGRGNEFADIRGAYGETDFRDIMAFCDAAIKKWSFIDRDRLGIAGGSYGGFMTNWAIGHTNRYKAAVSQRSIANWSAFSVTSDIGYYFGPDQVGATLWSDHEKVWDRSPLKYADKVKTPTLFIHSDSDYRCWMAEGLSMYSALMEFGVPARLCLFKGENHELSRSGAPKHRARRLKEMVDWFEKYL